MRIQYSVDDLRGFCSLVRRGHYTDAAEQLCITPSALSRRIQNLERAIGGRVFDRTTRKVLLTPAGAALYERVVPLLSELDSGLTEAARVARGEEGALVIATVATVAYSKLPQVLPDFSKRYPKVFLSIRDGIAASRHRSRRWSRSAWPSSASPRTCRSGRHSRQGPSPPTAST